MGDRELGAASTGASLAAGRRLTRRALLRLGVSAIGALPLVAACSPQPPAPAQQTETKPAVPAAQPTAAKPAATALVGAQIGGAQPTAIPTPTGQLQNPATLQAPRVKASAPTTLTFWQYVGFHVDVQKLIAEEYKSRHDPNVSLEITAYPGLNEQRTAVKAALAAQSPTPDIIAVEPGAYCVDVWLNNNVDGFNEIFAQDPEYKNGFWPNALSLLTINGETVSVPVVTNTVSVYYNRKLFADNGVQPPETVEDLPKLGSVFKAKDIAPLMIAAGEDRNHPVFPFYVAAGRLKADGLMREADLGQRPWTGPELLEVAQAAESIVRADYMIPGALGIKQQDGIQIFASGKAAMFWAGQWLRTSIRQALPPDFELGIFPFPALVAGGPRPTLSSVGITLTVNRNSKNRDLAFEMIKAITGAWGKIEYSRGLGISPNGPISPEAIAYQMQKLQDPLYPEFLKLQPTGTTRVLFTPQVEEAMYQGMQALFTAQKNSRQVMEEVETASRRAGERKFTVG
jgi:raffinose/stachyose/melibiose transport system substrate-binding protein